MTASIYKQPHILPQYNLLILQQPDVPVFQDILLFHPSEIYSDMGVIKSVRNIEILQDIS